MWESVLLYPQAGKDNRGFVGIVIICGTYKYCIPLSSPKEKHRKMKNNYSLLIQLFLREIGKTSNIISNCVFRN